MSRPPDDRCEAWKRELERTRDCISVERFAGNLTAAEREHLAHCARCEAELALWQEFHVAEPAADEGAAVQWVVAEIRRRLQEPTESVRSVRRFEGWREWMRVVNPRTLAVAATVVTVAAIGYVVVDRSGPRVGVPSPGTAIYRSEAVRLIAPSGDIDAPPKDLQWAPVANAVRYDVELREVDGTVVWRASTTGTRAELPAAIAVQFAPGRPLLWHVTARMTDGSVVAESGTERVRVSIRALPRER